MSVNRKLWLSRLFIVLVTAWNLQAGIVFILFPDSFSPAYELSGAAGAAAVQGIGVLFLMWNVPYLFAVWNPIRYKQALIFALLMQFVGLIGESYIFSTISVEHALLRASILRFISFDMAGLLMLLFAYLWVKNESNTH